MSATLPAFLPLAKALPSPKPRMVGPARAETGKKKPSSPSVRMWFWRSVRPCGWWYSQGPPFIPKPNVSAARSPTQNRSAQSQAHNTLYGRDSGARPTFFTQLGFRTNANYPLYVLPASPPLVAMNCKTTICVIPFQE